MVRPAARGWDGRQGPSGISGDLIEVRNRAKNGNDLRFNRMVSLPILLSG